MKNVLSLGGSIEDLNANAHCIVWYLKYMYLRALDTQAYGVCNDESFPLEVSRALILGSKVLQVFSQLTWCCAERKYTTCLLCKPKELTIARAGFQEFPCFKGSTVGICNLFSLIIEGWGHCRRYTYIR